MSCEVSIIVPAHNEERFLPGLLDSIRRHGPADAEVFIVDNGSVDNTPAVVAARGARLVRLPRKIFPSSARNAGVAEASGSVFVFLDADVELSEEWQHRWAATLDSLRQDPRQITGDQYHVSRHPSWIERVWFAPLREKTPSYINGGNLITTRMAFESIRGFDDQLETGEDVDFCKRAQEAGIAVKVDTGLKVFHEGYPKTASRFIRRERWHGISDFRNLDQLVRSRVALATIVFLGLHAVLAASVILSAFSRHGLMITAGSVFAIAGLCLAGCVQKFPSSGWRMRGRAIPIMYIYYVGRSLSLWDAIRRRMRPAATGNRHR